MRSYACLLFSWVSGQWESGLQSPLSLPHYIALWSNHYVHPCFRVKAYVMGHQCGARLTKVGRLLRMISAQELVWVEIHTSLVDRESEQGKVILSTSVTFFYKRGSHSLRLETPKAHLFPG